MSSSQNLAPAAAAGFQDAAAYDTHRPAYPAEAVQKLLVHMRLAAGGDDGDGEVRLGRRRIVEVAAGTGKFTEALARRGEGFAVLATEPQ